MKLESMSDNIVSVMKTLSTNEMLARLLYFTNKNPYDLTNTLPTDFDKILIQSGKISPIPFDVEATINDNVFLRIYYNDGDFNENEVIAESQLHIDIVCATSLWMLHDGTRNRNLIRPYDIAGRVIDLVGKRSVGTHKKLKFTGYQHMYINTKFHCIRLYSEYMSVEA